MKFNLEKKDIDSALLSLSAVADKKQTLPVLSNILIKAQENRLNMLSTDLEIELEMDVKSISKRTPIQMPHPAFFSIYAAAAAATSAPSQQGPPPLPT